MINDLFDSNESLAVCTKPIIPIIKENSKGIEIIKYFNSLDDETFDRGTRALMKAIKNLK